MPAVRNIRRSIRRVRQAQLDHTPLPRDKQTLVIPDKYQRLPDNEQFLLFDSGVGDDERLLIFATPTGLNTLSASSHWFVDGTFKVVPQIFFQIYSVHALVADNVIPCVFALLPNKSQRSYDRFWQALKGSNSRLEPISIMMDYEAAAMNSVGANFQHADVQGCLFHLSQCVYRHVQAAGLQTLYQSDADISLQARMLPALAFLPADDVETGFEALQVLFIYVFFFFFFFSALPEGRS